MSRKNETPKFIFTQNTSGQHIIRDSAGNELTIDTTTLTIDTTKLTMDDIRELLSGFGYIMQSIASHTWNQELTSKD